MVLTVFGDFWHFLTFLSIWRFWHFLRFLAICYYRVAVAKRRNLPISHPTAIADAKHRHSSAVNNNSLLIYSLFFLIMGLSPFSKHRLYRRCEWSALILVKDSPLLFLVLISPLSTVVLPSSFVFLDWLASEWLRGPPGLGGCQSRGSYPPSAGPYSAQKYNYTSFWSPRTIHTSRMYIITKNKWLYKIMFKIAIVFADYLKTNSPNRYSLIIQI